MFQVMNNIFLDDMEGHTIEEIPLGNWLVLYDKMKDQFYLERTNDFKLPEKIYGECTELATRYLNSYNTWDGNLGVLLEGMKGTGKSLLAKEICVRSKKPVIIIQHAYGGSKFLNFLSKIKQNVVIFLDEFEKVYADYEQQNMLLSILDGTFNSKFLFLLTINNEADRMNDYMMNRPSRIHYHQHYEGMSMDMIREICVDLLDDKENVESALAVCTYIGDISMDIIISLIKEINLYPKESPMEVLKYMNLEPSSSGFSVKIIRDGKILKKDCPTNSNPITNNKIYLEWWGENIDTMENDVEDGDEAHNPEDKQWNTFDYNFIDDEGKDSTKIKIKNGEIRIDYNEEYTDGTHTKWTFIYGRKKTILHRYF